VLDGATEWTHAQLRAQLTRAVMTADPAGAQRRHDRARARRRVVVSPGPDGMAELWSVLPADGAATVWSALTALADRAKTTALAAGVCARDIDPIDARRVDALITLAAAALVMG
jgi:hypothetical protein